jgi:hypothetical protein
LTLSRAADDPMQAMNTQSNITKNHCHESALMAAAHILIRLTQEGKSIKEIAREDFDNNLELVSVWVDYMVALNWIHNNTGANSENRWVATYSGNKWVEKVTNPCLYDDM